MGASIHDTLEDASDSDMDNVRDALLHPGLPLTSNAQSVENRTLLPEDNPAEESFMSRSDPLTKLIASSSHKSKLRRLGLPCL